MYLGLGYITKYIDDKIKENEKVIEIKFYDLVVKENLSKEQIAEFLEFSTRRLRNLGYTIYNQGDTYKLDDEIHIVDNNLFYVAIK